MEVEPRPPESDEVQDRASYIIRKVTLGSLVANTRQRVSWRDSDRLLMKRFLAYYRLSNSQLNNLLLKESDAVPDDGTPKPSLRDLADRMNIDVAFLEDDEWRALKGKLVSSMRHTLRNLIDDKILVCRFDEGTRADILHWSNKARDAFLSDEWWKGFGARTETVEETEDGAGRRGDNCSGGGGDSDSDGGSGGDGRDIDGNDPGDQPPPSSHRTAPDTPPATPHCLQHRSLRQGAGHENLIAWLLAQRDLPPTAPSTPHATPQTTRDASPFPHLETRPTRALEALFEAERSLRRRRTRHTIAYFDAIDSLRTRAGEQSRWRVLASLALSSVQPLLLPTVYTLAGATALDRAHVAHHNAQFARDAAVERVRDGLSGRGFRGVWPDEAW